MISRLKPRYVLSSLFKGLVFDHATVLLIVGFLPLLLQLFACC
jgi:hypothetical protein